jgi:LPS O-antigen subunit length determinant protein (WzzB/FepE family)
MTDNKFTDEMPDEAIIKALKRCTSSTTSEACNGCPFSETGICEKMSNALEIYALDLINRQKAEIERLQDEHDGRIKSLAAAFKIAEAEERCKAYILSQKAEAIKEFARRLTNTIMGKLDASDNAPDRDFYFITDVYEDIDNLEKEMTEVKK